MLSKTVKDMGFKSTLVDPDVYIRRNKKENGEPYYELLLVYVDDLMCVSHNPRDIMIKIGDTYKLKDGQFGPPDRYLRSGIERLQLPD